MSERKPNGYWKNPENVDRAFDELKEKLGRTPKYREFTKYGGAIYAIVFGAYHPNVRTFNDYLSHRGENLNNKLGKWTPENVDKAFDELKEKLGRVPTYREIQGSCGGMLAAIINGNYNSDVQTWNQYLNYRNQKLNNESRKWTPENIDRAYDAKKKELGRIPKQEEFYAGALGAIGDGRYSLDVRNWNQYLIHRGESVVFWTPENVDKVFDGLVGKLGRIPTSTEFVKEYSGAWSAVTAGNYHPDVRGWKSFLLHKGLELSRRDWTPENVDGAYDELREELGRTPTAKEFRDKNSGAISAIFQKRYHPKINSWNEYLIHRGIKPNRIQRNRLEILENLLEDGE